MPASSITMSPPSHNQYLQTLLESARPFLRRELESVDPKLPSLVAVLRSVGAGECWHKHGSFLDHLVDIYKILKLWKAQDSVCLCGLFHSAYSNSYVNLAIFDPSTGRDTVRQHVGEAAERLIHLFCIVPRQSLIHDDLLFNYTDAELVEHLKVSENSLKDAKEKGVFDSEASWRKKIQSLVPASGVNVKHIKTGETLLVSRRVVATFLMMTMADFSDQMFGFQDALFDNSNGRLEFSENNFTALWPGDGKPGLWLNSISRMGAIYSLIVREEEMFMEERKRGSDNDHEVVFRDRDEDLELVIPPVFEKCTRVLDAGEQIAARDLYWEGVCDMPKRELGLEKVEELLRMSVEKNPFVGEPHVLLAQICLSQGRYENAEEEAEKGLRLLLEWGSPWDKRMSWEGWIAWVRVLLMKAKDKTWPQTSWGLLNLDIKDGACVMYAGDNDITNKAEPYLKGVVLPLQDNVPEDPSNVSSKVSELKKTLYNLNSLEIKLKASKEAILQTQTANSLLWSEKESLVDCEESFLPSSAERVSFAALQPISGTSELELLELQKEKLNAMDVKETVERLEISLKLANNNISLLAAKLAIQSLDLQ